MSLNINTKQREMPPRLPRVFEASSVTCPVRGHFSRTVVQIDPSHLSPPTLYLKAEMNAQPSSSSRQHLQFPEPPRWEPSTFDRFHNTDFTLYDAARIVQSVWIEFASKVHSGLIDLGAMLLTIDASESDMVDLIVHASRLPSKPGLAEFNSTDDAEMHGMKHYVHVNIHIEWAAWADQMRKFWEKIAWLVEGRVLPQTQRKVETGSGREEVDSLDFEQLAISKPMLNDGDLRQVFCAMLETLSELVVKVEMDSTRQCQAWFGNPFRCGERGEEYD